jgi:hypothetical protein
MNEQILKDLVATAQKYNYNWNVILPKFPELKKYNSQLLKDYVATAEKHKYNYSVVNGKFPEFGFKKKEPTVSPSKQDQKLTSSATQPKTNLKPSVSSSSTGPKTDGKPDGLYQFPGNNKAVYKKQGGEWYVDPYGGRKFTKLYKGDVKSRVDLLEKKATKVYEESFDFKFEEKPKQTPIVDKKEEPKEKLKREMAQDIFEEEFFVTPKKNMSPTEQVDFVARERAIRELGKDASEDQLKVAEEKYKTSETLKMLKRKGYDVDVNGSLDDPKVKKALAEFNANETFRLNAEGKQNILDKNIDNIINSKLMGATEEYTVPLLNKNFGKYGFIFEETGVGDAMTVRYTTDNGLTYSDEFEIDLQSGDPNVQMNKLKSFMKGKYLNDYEKSALNDENLTTEQLIKTMASDPKKYGDYMLSEGEFETYMTRQYRDVAQYQKEINFKIDEFDKLKQQYQETGDENTLAKLKELDSSIKADQKKLIYRESELEQIGEKYRQSVGEYVSNKGEEGNFIGGITSSFAKGVTSGSKALLYAGMDAVAPIFIEDIVNPIEYSKLKEEGLSDSEISDKVTSQVKRTIVKDINEGITNIGSLGTVSEEYFGSKDRNLVEKALFGLAESVGAGITGATNKTAQALSFFAMSYNAMQDEFSSEEFDSMSNLEKQMWSGVYGLVIGQLEKIGFNVASGQTKSPLFKKFASNVIMNAIKEAPEDAAIETIDQLIGTSVKNTLKATGIKVANGMISEGTTEGVQSLFETSMKGVINEIHDKKLFSYVPDLTTKEGVKYALETAAEEFAAGAIGGAVMGSYDSYTKRRKNKRTDEDFLKLYTVVNDNILFKSLKINEIEKYKNGDISLTELKDKISSINEIAARINKIPENLNVRSKRIAFDLINEKESLNKSIQGKDANLVKPQLDRIAEIDNQLKKIGEDAVKESANKEVTAEGGGVQYQGTQEGQPEVGQREGTVGETTQPETDLGNSPVEGRSEEEIDKLIEERIGKYSIQPDDLFADMSEADNNIIEKASKGESVDINALNGTIDYLYKKYKEITSLKKNKKERLNKSTTISVLNNIQQDIENDLDFLMTYKGEVEQGNNPITIEEFNNRPTSDRKVFMEESPLVEQETTDATQIEPTTQEQAVTETAPVEQPVVEQPVVEQPVVEQPQAEQVSASRLEELGKVIEGTPQQIDEQVDSIRLDNSNSRVANSIKSAAKAISKILPDVKFIVHDNEESYRKVTGDTSRGYYNPTTMEIHINLKKANNRTAVHEVFHAIILSSVKNDAEAQRLTKAMITSVMKSLVNMKDAGKILRYLQDFESGYEENIRDEEKLAELTGILFDNFLKLPAPTQNIIQRWLDRLAKLFGLKPLTDKETIDFINYIATSVRIENEMQDYMLPTKIAKTISEMNARKQIIGENANLAQNVRDNLQVARDMENAGKSVKAIRIATGWERGADKKWRYEIPDLKFKEIILGRWDTETSLKDIIAGALSGGLEQYNLNKIISNDELFDLYPQLKKISLAITNSYKTGFQQMLPKNVDAAVFTDYGVKTIAVKPTKNIELLEATIAHEIQHIIQEKEGFAVGADINTFGEEKYIKSSGEVESRNIEKRMKMTPEERRQTTLQETEDVSREDQIIFFEGQEEKSIRNQIDNSFEARNQNPQSIASIIKVARENGFTDQEITQYLLQQGYDQDKIDSAMKFGVASGTSIDDVFETSTRELESKLKKGSIGQRLITGIRSLRKSLIDRQADIKRSIKGIKNTDAINAYNKLVNKAGATGFASLRFKILSKKIYGGLNEDQLNALDKMIYARRIISVNENRAKKGLEPYRGIRGYSEADAQNDLVKLRNDLGEKIFNKLSQRADDYFNVFSENLLKLKQSGRISEEVYNELKDIEYSPIKTIKYIVKDNYDVNDLDNEAAKLGISKKDIMALGDRNENGIITDSKWLLMLNISSVESRVFENKMLNDLVAALENATAQEKASLSEFFIFDNPIIGNYKTDGRPKRKYDEQSLPDGYRKLHYFDNGVDRYLIVREDIAKQLLNVKNSKILPAIENFSEEVPVLGWLAKHLILTPTRLLRFFATGGNPMFILGNVPMDWTNAVFFSDVYSNVKLIGMVQAGTGFSKNFLKKIWKDFSTTVLKGDIDKVYMEYAEHGGLMDTMSQEGMRNLENLKPKGKLLSALPKTIFRPTAKFTIEAPYRILKAYGSVLSYMGETSEVAFRLAVYEKTKNNLIREFKKKNNVDPNSKQLDDIMWNAAREARELIDFNQGGTWAKELDVFMPYFNAAMQGVRRPLDFARKNPLGFSTSMLQLAGMAGSLVGLSLSLGMSAFADDDEEEKKKKIKNALNSISTYEKANYHIIFTGEKDENGELEYIRIKKLPVASIISTFAEELVYNKLLGYDIDYKNVSEAVSKSSPLSLSELGSKNPFISGIIAYAYNIDTFTGEEIVRLPKDKKINITAEGMFDDKVEGLYKTLAPQFGMSPARTKAFVEKIITTESTNPTINLFYAVGNGIFDPNTTFGNELSLLKDEIVKQGSKKLIRYTNKNIIKYNLEDELEKKEMDIETEIYLKEQSVYNKIKKQAESGNEISRDELRDIVTDTFDRRDREKYIKKYMTYSKNMDIDKSLLDLIYEDNPEVTAMKLFERYGSDLDDNDKKELKEAMRASGRKLSTKAIQIYRKEY